MAVELATAYVSIVPDTSQVAPGVSRAFRDTEASANESGTRSGKKFSEGAKAAAVAGGALVGAAFAKALDSAMEFGSINAKFEASLGVTKKQAGDMGKAAADVYKQGFGENIQDVAKTIEDVTAGLSNAFDDPKKDLEDFTKYALNFNKVFGVETATSVQTVSQLITNGLASNGEEAFDLLTTAFQRVPAAMRDELPEILDEYGTNFRALGFNGEQSFNLLVAAAQKGKFALDKTGDALKEFTIRATDGSKTTTDAFAKISVDATAMSNAIAGGGPEAQAAMQQIVAGLQSITDPSEKAQTALALFGTPLEDLSVDQIPQFLEALQGGTNDMGGFAGATERMGEALGGTPQAKFEAFKRTLQEDLTQSLMGVTEWMGQNQTAAIGLAAVIGTLGAAVVVAKVATIGWNAATTIATGLTKAWTAVQWLFNAAMSANPITLVIIGIAALVAAIVLAYQHSETFRNIVQAAWSGIQSAFSAAWAFIKPIWDGFLEAMGWVGDKLSWLYDNVVSPVLDLIGKAFHLWWTGVQIYFNLWKIALGLIGEALSWFWENVVSPVMGWIGEKISDAWNTFIKPAWDAFQIALDALGTAFKAMWEVYISPAWEALKTGLKAGWDLIKGYLDDGLTAFNNLWEGIKKVLGWIKDAWDTVSGIFDKVISGADKLKDVTGGAAKALGFASGGWTGPGGKYDVAGVVHADEFVISKAARNSIEAQAPGLLSYMNSTGNVPGYAEGGLVSAEKLVEFAKGVEGKPYVWGGVNWGDCSGAISALANFATGRPPFSTRFATATEQDALVARGFTLGTGPSGALNIGWYNGGPYGGHTAATLPNGVNFEMGGDRGDGQYGGAAKGANWSQFTDHAYIKLASAAALDALGTKSDTPDTSQKKTTPEGDPNKGDDNGDSQLATTDDNSSSSGFSLQDSFTGNINSLIDTAIGDKADDNTKRFAAAGASFLTGQLASIFEVTGMSDSPSWLKAGSLAWKAWEDQQKKNKSKKYDNGGWLEPGFTLVENKTGKPEPVFNPGQWDTLSKSIVSNGGSTGVKEEVHYHTEGIDDAMRKENLRRRTQLKSYM